MTLPDATLAEGPLGLEGLHGWSGLVLGNVDSFPRFKLDRITGLRDRADTDDNRVPATGRPGEVIYPSQTRGKTIVYEGRVQALDPVTLAEARTGLLAATALSSQGALSFGPFPDRGGVTWFAVARVITCVCDEEQTRGPNARPSPWQRSFVLSFRMHLPMFFANPQQTETDDESCVCVNSGLAPTYPILNVSVASGTHDVSITNATISAVLQFDDLPGAGDLIVNFVDRTATIDGDDAVPYLNDAASNWWDEDKVGMAPGSNTITQSGGTDLTVSWFHATF